MKLYIIYIYIYIYENMGAFVYAVTAADVIRLRHLRKRLQRSLSFVYAGI